MSEHPLRSSAAGLSLGLLLALWRCSAMVPATATLAGLILRRPVLALTLVAGFLYGELYLHRLGAPPVPGVRHLAGTIEEVHPLREGMYFIVKTSLGRGTVYSRREIPDCRAGDTFQALVRLRRKGGYLNPFSTPESTRLLARGLSFRGSLVKERILCFEGSPGPMVRLRERLLFFAEGLKPASGGLFAALVLGEKGLLPEDLRERIRKKGIYHLLAVSGWHLGLLYGLVYLLVRFVLGRLPAPPTLPLQIPASFAGLFGAALYGALSGFPASARRALTMLLLYTLSRCLFRRTRAWDILSAAVIFLFLLHPGAVLDLSFRLSVLAVAGIILAHHLISPHLRERPRLLRYPLEGLVMSLGAWLLTLPLLLYTFGEVPLLGPVNTLIAAPLWGFAVIPLEMAAGALAPFRPEEASLLADLAARLATLSLSITLPSPALRPPFPVGLFLMALAFAALAPIALIRGRRRTASAAALLAASLFASGVWVKERLFYLELFDIGRGSAALLHLPGDRNVLLDAGARYGSFNAGERVLLPALLKLGVSRLDLVILSHPDLDHVGGLPALRGHMPVKEVLSGPFGPASWRKSGLAKPPEPVRRPEVVRLAGAEMFLFPGRPSPARSNPESLVTYAEYRGLTVLFPGDIEESRWRRMLARGSILPTEVFVLPHHGARDGLYPPAWRALRFRVALASARGAKHPHPVVRRWLKEKKRPLYETARDGALTVFIRGETFLTCRTAALYTGLPKALLWPYIHYILKRGCHEYALHTLRDL